MNRMKTEINGFDELIEGGIPEQSISLISGSPGTGKTIFCFETLVNGCTQGETGIFLSFEQSEEDILSQMSKFNWNVDKYVKNGKLIVKHVDILENENIFDLLRQIVPKTGKNRLVIDSLTALQNYPALLKNADHIVSVIGQPKSQYSISEESIHRMLTHYFINMLKSLPNTTSLLITDIPDDSNQLSSDGTSGFMADAIIVLYYLGLGGDSAHNIQIRKMRWTQQSQGYFPFKITPDGIKIETDAGKSILMK